jgi:hypothetical protein
MAEGHKQYSGNSNSIDDKWHKSMFQTVQNFEKLQLSTAQREALMKSVGTSQTEILSKKWGFLSESAPPFEIKTQGTH